MPKPRGRRVRRSEKEWQTVLQRFEASGLSTREFCRRAGVSLSSLQRRRQQTAKSQTARFVDLTPAAASVPEASTWTVELALPSGITLTLRG